MKLNDRIVTIQCFTVVMIHAVDYVTKKLLQLSIIQNFHYHHHQNRRRVSSISSQFKAVTDTVLAGIVDFESRRGHGCLSLTTVVFCQVEVCALGCSLVRRGLTEYVCVCVCVCVCDREVSIMGRPWPH